MSSIVQRVRATGRFWREEQGAALVEMTLITPFMLLIAAGVFEFSGIMHTKLMIEAGLRDGARYIARCYRSDPATACESAGRSIAVNGLALTPRVSDWTTDLVQVAYETTPITIDEDGLQNYRSNSGSVHVVRVSTDYPYIGSGLAAYIGLDDFTLSMEHEERVIGW
ncbi:pilus assembly protein [Devosia sp. XJ19-1]|nr:TadE/TadG family type IV pilus assembly protein [Devosia ureilytica]MCP8883579.1 pilus assembly protein [Devosia ureilytica]